MTRQETACWWEHEVLVLFNLDQCWYNFGQRIHAKLHHIAWSSCSADAPIFSGVWSWILRYTNAQKRRIGPLLSIPLWIPFIYKRCNFVLFNVISFSSELLMRRVKGNYWQRPRHLKCSYQHSFIIMMSSGYCSAVLHLRRCYYTERKYWAAEVTSNMVNCWLINGWATTRPAQWEP